MSDNPVRSRVRESARQRRLDIIEAALRVMRRDGLRAITHRAVASEADVPLAATTYYFRDLEDLLTESFLHWSETQRDEVESFYRSCLAILAAGASVPGDVAARLADTAADYIVAQVGAGRADRILEFAFLHEAMRFPRLREAVQRQQRTHIEFLTEFHAHMGSSVPAVDAHIANSLLLGLEKAALLAGSEAIDRDATRAVLLRYLTGLPGAAEQPAAGVSATTPPPRTRGGKKPLSSRR